MGTVSPSIELIDLEVKLEEIVRGLSPEASALCGPRVYSRVPDCHILVIVRDFPKGVDYKRVAFGQGYLHGLLVDEKLLKEEIERNFLCGFLIGHLMTPYEPIKNAEFLFNWEKAAGRKYVKEAIIDLTFECLDATPEVLIHPRYFLYEYLQRRVRVYPPLRRYYLHVLYEEVRERNLGTMMKKYETIIREFAKEGIIYSEDSHIRVSIDFMEDILGRKVGVYRIPEVMKEFISMKITGIRSRLSIMSRKVLSMIDAELACIGRVTGTLEDPKKYLYLRTRLGLVKLSEKASMEGIVERVFGPVSRIEAKKVIGTDIIGIFNTLYEVSFSQNSKEKKVVVKKFDDWASFKWFPAALYTLGVQDFAVLGRERLAKEYIFNRMLRERGFHVPDILYASWEDKLLLEEFIEGETLGEIVQRIATRGHASQEDLNIAKKIGKLIAQVHNEGIVLGDCKPDNVIVTGDGRLYFVDLEQARRGGNPAWDLVEFLCFSARYIAPLLHTEGLVKFLKNFLQGYLMGGGAKDTIKEASQAKYLRLFAFLILPTTLLKIRRVCREVLRETL